MVPTYQPRSLATIQSMGGWDIDQLLRQRHIEYETHEGTSNSGERWTVYQLACPFSEDHDDGFAITRWDNGAVAARCHHDRCKGKGWDDVKRVWQLPDSTSVSAKDITLPSQAQTTKTELRILRSRDVQPEEIDWLWQDRLVLGGINLCCGRGGIGKTYFLCDLVARITNESLPAPNGMPLRHGRVLYATGEDHLNKVIEPRMQQHRADRDRLDYICGLPTGRYVQLLDVIGHCDLLRDALGNRPDTVALVLDPISSFQGGADSNKVTQVRQFTAVLSQISEEFNIAILGIHHFNKGKREIAGDSISGSHAYRDAGRAIWLFALDRDDPSRRLMVCDKHNWAPDRPPGLAYRIEAGQVIYEPEPLEMTSDELMTQGEQRSLDIACSWLLTKLNSGRQPAIDLQIGAAAEGIKDRTLQRAKKRLQIGSRRENNQWFWQLPTECSLKQG